MLDFRALLFAATAMAGITWASTGAATDEEISQPVPDVQGVAPKRFLCRVFATALSEPVDTRDRSSELGRWVIDFEGRGWQVDSLDFEVGQKPTGFAEGFVSVCLTPVLTTGD